MGQKYYQSYDPQDHTYPEKYHEQKIGLSVDPDAYRAWAEELSKKLEAVAGSAENVTVPGRMTDPSTDPNMLGLKQQEQTFAQQFPGMAANVEGGDLILLGSQYCPQDLGTFNRTVTFSSLYIQILQIDNVSKIDAAVLCQIDLSLLKHEIQHRIRKRRRDTGKQQVCTDLLHLAEGKGLPDEEGTDGSLLSVWKNQHIIIAIGKGIHKLAVMNGFDLALCFHQRPDHIMILNRYDGKASPIHIIRQPGHVTAVYFTAEECGYHRIT